MHEIVGMVPLLVVNWKNPKNLPEQQRMYEAISELEKIQKDLVIA
jgi:hypothetical protein